VYISSAQVGIGVTSPEAGLDITSNTTGLLIPRVSLTSLSVELPVVNPKGIPLAESTLVYHDGTGSINAGFYYWDGVKWVLLTTTESIDWTVSGNNGITAANFIGTINAADFVVRTTNTERMRVLSTGNVGLGQALPTANLDVKGNLIVGSSANWSGSVNAITDGAIIEGQTVIGANGAGVPSSIGYLTAYDSAANTVALAGVTTALAGANSIGVYGVSDNDNTAMYAVNNDDGYGVYAEASDNGIGVLGTAGNNGIGVYGYVPGTGNDIAMYGFNSGTFGKAGTFYMNNGAADDTSLGLLVVYEGDTYTGSGGGGNAFEVQHNGTNGNAVELFLGDPTGLPGNITSDYSTLNISQMATGTSGFRSKNCINARNYSEDATVYAVNLGTGNGPGVMTSVTSNSANPARSSIEAYSYNGANAEGIGVYGYGGLSGVAGRTASPTGFGIYSMDDVGAPGAKSFVIDYPLDPANKTLRHYAVEANEIVNMYRGTIVLDDTGKIMVQLPEYFSVINKDVSYVLTAIGTPVHPYVSKEHVNNTFEITGAPNTKVSWVVYGKRNDPTIQYFDTQRHYDDEVKDKPSHLRGKYHTPEAYGLGISNGIVNKKPLEPKDRELKAETVKPIKKITSPKVNLKNDTVKK